MRTLTRSIAPPAPEAGTLVRQNLMSLAVVQDHVCALPTPLSGAAFPNLGSELTLGRADLLSSPAFANGDETLEAVSANGFDLSFRIHADALPGVYHMVRSTHGAI